VPFFDPDLGAENTFVLASPGFVAGGALVTLTSRLQGAEANGLVTFLSRPGLRASVLAGFRYVDLRENLTFANTSTGVQDPTAEMSNNGLIVSTQDQFDTHNQFYGWQVGLSGEYRQGGLSVSAFAKLALGDMNEAVTVSGASATNFFNAPAGGPFTGVPTQVVPQSGIFAQPTNVGRITRHEIAVVPAVGVNVGYEVVSGLRVFVGYDFLYLSDVVRPGNQIDRTVSTAQTVPGAVAGIAPAPGTRPVMILSGSEFWAQGLNVGLEYRY
jgi:hypothetical protein